jgi:internalin A
VFVYLLVLDARKDKNVPAQIREWIKRVKTTGGNSPIIVIANQADVNAGFGFSNESDLQKEFPEIKYFIKVSCKTGSGVDEIKQKLEELIPQAELFNTEIDERWIAIKEQLQEETKSKHFLDEGRFEEICSDHRLNEKAGRLNAIHFFNDLGLLLHFEELNLAQYYVLDPYWITYGVYQIVTSAQAGRLKGIVPMDSLEYIINEEEDKKDVYKPANSEKILYDTNQRRFLVDILNQFKLCFYLPGNAGFIIPNLLDTTEPIAVTVPLKNAKDSIQFVYKYEYLPNSVLPNIMVESHSLLGEKWRTGCILKGYNCKALVSAYQDTLTITVRGEHKQKREFMAVIRNCIDRINQGLAVKPQMLIPLPGITPIDYPEYEVLLNREKKGKREFIFHEDRPDEKNFEISRLLEGIATPDEMKEISRRLDRIDKNVETIIQRLDEHYWYLIEKLDDDQISDKITEALKPINAQQTAKIADVIMQQIATAFDLFSVDMDERFTKIYHDLKKTDNLEAKLRLSVPFIKLLGIDIGLEAKFDIKKWASGMYDKYKLQIFQLMV